MLAYLKSPHNNKTLQAVQFNYICMSAPRKKSTLWHEKIASIVFLNLSWFWGSGYKSSRLFHKSSGLFYKSSGFFLRPKFSIYLSPSTQTILMKYFFIRAKVPSYILLPSPTSLPHTLRTSSTNTTNSNVQHSLVTWQYSDSDSGPHFYKHRLTFLTTP